MRTFAYCRVSTSEQTTENQILAIKNAGYDIADNRVISETISGSTPAMERPLFNTLVTYQLEQDDTLIVLKLDRLGRDNIDVQKTIDTLLTRKVKVISLDLPISDLSTSEGKLMLQMLSAFAEFERNRIKERTKEGLLRAKAEGRRLGRPRATKTTARVQKCRNDGLSQSKTSSVLNISIATVKRHWNKKIQAK